MHLCAFLGVDAKSGGTACFHVLIRTWLFYFVLLNRVRLFKFVFLLLPILTIVIIAIRLTTKKSEHYKKKMNLIIILLGFSFLHLLLHTVTGAIIDRYAVPAFITTILGTFMFVELVCNNRNLKKK